MSVDLAHARADTPGCAHVAHFNNAGAALPPRPVIEAVRRHLELEATIGGYEAADAAHEATGRFYDAVATLLSCHRDEVAFVESATRGWDMAFHALRFREGDRILTGRAEYASNVIAMLREAERTGASLEIVPDDAAGQIDVSALEAMIDDRVKLIALTHVPTNGGLVNPAEAVGAVARRAGVPYLLDACQSAGQMPLDVDRLCCDMLSATGRKFLRGPRGTGFLYVRRGWIEKLDPPFLDLHSATWTGPRSYAVRGDARRFEQWERDVAGQIGLGVAVGYALSFGLAAIWSRVSMLADSLRARLAALPGVSVHDKGAVRSGIVTFKVDGETADSVQRRLRGQAINTSTSTAGNARFDMPERGLDALVRASVHYYNSEEEIARLCEAVARR